MINWSTKYVTITLYILIILLFRLNVFSNDFPSSNHYNNLGFFSLQNGNLSEAENYFQKAIEINSGVKYYHNNIAIVHIRKKQYGKAYVALKKALSIDARYSKGLVNISICCFYLRKYYEAYKYYRLSIKYDPEYVRRRFQYQKAMKRIEKRRAEIPQDRTIGLLWRYLKEQKSSFNQ